MSPRPGPSGQRPENRSESPGEEETDGRRRAPISTSGGSRTRGSTGRGASILRRPATTGGRVLAGAGAGWSSRRATALPSRMATCDSACCRPCCKRWGSRRPGYMHFGTQASPCSGSTGRRQTCSGSGSAIPAYERLIGTVTRIRSWNFGKRRPAPSASIALLLLDPVDPNGPPARPRNSSMFSGGFWLRGRATGGTCSCGAARHQRTCAMLTG